MTRADLRARLEDLAARRRLDWSVRRDAVVVTLPNAGRTQTIRYGLEAEHIVLETVVLSASAYVRDLERWNRVAIRCWLRNAESNLVTFSFDANDNLIARVQHLAAHLDPDEIELYVQTLAAESDRFEYVLTGEDER